MREASWVRIATLAELPEDDALAAVVDGLEVALYQVAGEVFATDNRCTHGDARLSDGFMSGSP